MAAEKHPDDVMLKVERVNGEAPAVGKDNKPPPALPDDQWTTWTYSEALADAQAIARGFIKLGFQHFDSVNIWGFNSPEWILGAMAATIAGGKVAGLYPTDTPETAAYKVVHSGGSIVLIEEKAKYTKLMEGLASDGRATKIKAIAAWGYSPNEKVMIPGCGPVSVLGWQALKELAPAGGPEESILQTRGKATEPGHCAALIYTSGTTGMPKAVMISHDNIVFESSVVLSMLSSVKIGYGEERALSYLPLSHVAGMMVDIVCPLVATATSPGGGYITMYFARPYDLKLGTLKDRLQAARPTLFLGVPLVWEKVADKIRAIGAEVTGAKKKVATWAKGVGLEYSKNCQLGGTGAYPAGFGLADKLVLSKVKANLGLQELKFGFTGAAPIRVDTLEYYGSLGIQVNEVYGMSECTGACTWSSDLAHEWGSCGWEIPGVEVRCFTVDPENINNKKLVPEAPALDCTEEEYQGELCFRGRNIMMGYMANADLGQEHVDDINKKVAETIDAEGWLHSGDKGLITNRGMVKITGRYKELIIGDGGENIAPVPIEDIVKKTCDGINEVMMIGDKRKYNVALITLKAVGANGEVPGQDDLDAGAKRLVPGVATISAAQKDKAWIDAVTKAVEAANNNRKVCINAAFKIQKFTILPTNFSEQMGELTPTKKLKRKIVETRYASLIDRIYAENGTYIPFTAADAPAN
jgi:long-chain-fatty-acid--CoA ligase ACSBG